MPEGFSSWIPVVRIELGSLDGVRQKLRKLQNYRLSVEGRADGVVHKLHERDLRLQAKLIDLLTAKTPTLKAWCRARGLPVSGAKAELAACLA